MFTGIVEELGEIRECIPAGKAMRFSLKAPVLSPKLKIGDSVACDGVCLTVEQCNPIEFSVSAVPETLDKTTLGTWKVGDGVNLESALTPQTPMGGHFVMGHVDGVCKVIAVEFLAAGEGREITIRLPSEFLPYCVYKGSLTLSGISLTIAAVEGDCLRFAIIPHTLEVTNLIQAEVGTHLNFEVDVLAKYVERQLSVRVTHGSPVQTMITEAKMDKWGYAIS